MKKNGTNKFEVLDACLSVLDNVEGGYNSITSLQVEEGWASITFYHCASGIIIGTVLYRQGKLLEEDQNLGKPNTANN